MSSEVLQIVHCRRDWFESHKSPPTTGSSLPIDMKNWSNHHCYAHVYPGEEISNGPHCGKNYSYSRSSTGPSISAAAAAEVRPTNNKLRSLFSLLTFSSFGRGTFASLTTNYNTVSTVAGTVSAHNSAGYVLFLSCTSDLSTEISTYSWLIGYAVSKRDHDMWLS